MLEVIGLVFPFFGLILIGYILGRRSQLSQDQMGWMNFFIIYVALPPLFFKLMAKTPVSELANWRFVLGTTGVTFILFVCVVLIALKLRRDSLPDAMIQGFAGAYGNIGYMAPGLALTAFGPQAALPVALIFCFDNALHFTMAPLIMAKARNQGAAVLPLVGEAVWNILKHPFILATIVGVGAAAIQLQLPEPAESMVDLLANAAAPCALFAMGVTLAQRPLQSVPIELSYIIPVKLIVHPLLVWLALGVLGPFPAVWVHTAMLICALPTATNVFVLAQQYETWATKASAAILTTTFLAIITVSTLLYMIKQGLVPV